MATIARFTLVETYTSQSGRPSVRVWTPSSYEQPGLSSGWKIAGVTSTAASDTEDIAVIRYGVLRDVTQQNNESWSVGDILWAKSGGSITMNRPSAPLPQIYVGQVFAKADDLCSVAVNVTTIPSLGELSGVTSETPADKDVPIFNVSNHTWDMRQLDHGADIAGLTDNDHPAYQRKHGFELGTDGSHQLTISYDESTRKFTLTPTGSTFRFWVDGVQFIKTGAQVSGAHGTTTGKYFCYYDSAGVLQMSAVETPWSIRDRTAIPVAFAYYSSSLSKGEGYPEYHTADRMLEQHFRDHFSEGAKLISGLALTGYTPDTDSDVAVTFAVGAGVIMDEDVRHAISALADGGPYCVWSRDGATGAWIFDRTPTLPFLGSTYPAWNNPNGGGSGVWGLTDLVGTSNGNYCTYWVFATPNCTSARQIILVPGQATHASEDAAKGESVASLALGTLPFEEIVPIARVIYYAKSTFGGTKKTQIADVTYITSSGASVTSPASPSVHNSLSGREAAAAHPATSTTYDNTTSGLTAATVQAAIDELVANPVGGITNISDADDVNTTGRTDGQILAWDTGTSMHIYVDPGTPAAHAETHEPGGDDAISLALNDLSDVNAPTPSDGQALVWNANTSAWINGTVTGGSGAPTTAKYVVAEADAGLSAEIVKQYMGDNLDPLVYPGSPNAMDDEFEGGGSIDAKWTKVNDPSGGDAMNQTSIAGHLWVGLPEHTGTENFDSSVRLYQTPPAYSETWEFTAKVNVACNLANESSEFTGVLLYIGDNANDEFFGAMRVTSNVGWTTGAPFLMQYVFASVNGTSGAFGGTASEASNLALHVIPSFPLWLRLKKTTTAAYTSANTYEVWMSGDGLLWQQIGSSSKTFTGACNEIGLMFRKPKSQTGTAYGQVLVDFFRRTA